MHRVITEVVCLWGSVMLKRTPSPPDPPSVKPLEGGVYSASAPHSSCLFPGICSPLSTTRSYWGGCGWLCALFLTFGIRASLTESPPLSIWSRERCEGRVEGAAPHSSLSSLVCSPPNPSSLLALVLCWSPWPKVFVASLHRPVHPFPHRFIQKKKRNRASWYIKHEHCTLTFEIYSLLPICNVGDIHAVN